MPLHRISARVCAALILAAVCGAACAAELGEVVVRSHIGQPLVADIELTMLADPSAPVVVRLASPDVYKGANTTMHPALASANMSVMRRDGRQFLHLTSVKPVDSEYVHLFVELADGGKRNVRAETLWLTPDPNPAPPPPPPALPKPVAAAEPVPVPDRPVPRLPRPAAPAAACPAAEQIKACAATDYQNGLLSAQIVELEEKVKALELAMKGRAEPAVKTRPEPKPVLKPAAPIAAAEPAPHKGDGFPWLLTSLMALFVLAAGCGAMFIVSRRKGKSADTAAADSAAWYARLAGRFRRKEKAAPAPAAEPPKDA